MFYLAEHLYAKNGRHLALCTGDFRTLCGLLMVGSLWTQSNLRDTDVISCEVCLSRVSLKGPRP